MDSSSFLGLGEYTFFFFYLIFAFFFFFKPLMMALKNLSITSRVISSGGFSVEGLDVNAKGYYKAIAQRLREHNINGLRITMTSLAEKSPLMGTREYLTIQKDAAIFYVCTFKFGTSQVFTHWQVAPFELFERVLGNIPLIGKVITATFFPVTLYRMDEAGALNGIIQQSISEITQEYSSEDKGVRELAQADMQLMQKAYAV